MATMGMECSIHLKRPRWANDCLRVMNFDRLMTDMVKVSGRRRSKVAGLCRAGVRKPPMYGPAGSAQYAYGVLRIFEPLRLRCGGALRPQRRHDVGRSGAPVEAADD